ncbi:hypothetical protein SAMD00019534_056260 [Acytostelium subglobosum LB1]|uniref:hypothetical protein n=1 Tax=Acytostelium subglobosum LB1 TaxID=1410327 RepID=UPI000644AADF|nr:hypothetical protein SAMD00019534_056260 [Acytostelium subglobosum LB1]GAM22451.1 hypothetical protein SAMD00019534_056260 [Acytostelium subglobosum LB1]|eukprot:XP_012754571.1 hypothetical protein SAMD00019534_056260 [Acytostelium subglobosum LB1]
MIIKCSLVILLLIILTTNAQPEWWNERVAQGRLLSAASEPVQYLMPSVGNGYVSFVIGGPAIYIAGVYNGPAVSFASPSHRAQLPNFQNISLGSGATLQYAGLDIDNATYSRVYTFPNSPTTTATQMFYAHQTMRNVLVQHIIVDNTGSDTVFNLELNYLNYMETNDLNIQKIESNSLITQYNATILMPELPNGFITAVGITTSTVPEMVTVAAGAATTFYFVTSFVTNLETSDYMSECAAIYKQAYSATDSLLNTHINAWSGIWESRIEIGGNIDLARTVNASLYYTLSSVRQDWPWSISPGGLSSNGYNGHVFWDAETWMYPTILLLQPTIARDSIIQYRLNNLEQAHQKALGFNQGWTGYMFPWESAFTGAEGCPEDYPEGMLEHHITGDISFAWQQYYRMTNDKQWLQEGGGYQAIKGVAEFWASRASLAIGATPSQPSYEIDIVIPPDEYVNGFVNNSVYTNAVAQMALEWAIEAATIVNDTTAPTDQWRTIAQNLVMLYNETLDIHPEYEYYDGDTVKQADVILLGFPLMYNMSLQTRASDLAYYQERTTQYGPAMTYSMFTIGWLEVGDMAAATKSWSSSYSNSQAPFGVWTETPEGGTVNFITGAGGFLQAVAFGFSGLRIRPQQLDFNPQLPPDTESIKLAALNYLGCKLDVFWNESSIVIELKSQSNQDITLGLFVEGQLKALTQGVPVTLTKVTPFSIMSMS